ncbi:MAG: Y-family DNA polymerase [Bacteroidetes bacterium]|nr:Y-family DNA polymerase [Bacteroidota bacterium]
MNKLFALVDCNNFFVSCERVFNPKLENKPVVVLSNNDGCIISRSNEAKSLGLKMGSPFFKLKDFLKQNEVTAFSSNYSLYGDMSQRVMSILAKFSSNIEIYSIDEAFLDFSGFDYYNIKNYAREIKRIVFQWTGIPVSVGVGTTKTLAKIATHIAKKNDILKGVFIIKDEKELNSFLKDIPVNEVWGIGKQFNKKLIANNINTVFKLKNAEQQWIKKNFGIVGLRTIKELNGLSCISIERVARNKKGITSSRSFGKPVTEYEDLRQAISSYITTASRKLRKQKSLANILTIYILTNRFDKEHFYYNHKVIKLPLPTNNTSTFITFASEALRNIYVDGLKYKKAGIMLSEIIPEEHTQLSLFDNVDIKKSNILMTTIDNINEKMGTGTIKSASEGFDKKWKMKSEMRSREFTTCWDDILEV